jgi:hypothetical protein
MTKYLKKKKTSKRKYLFWLIVSGLAIGRTSWRKTYGRIKLLIS